MFLQRHTNGRQVPMMLNVRTPWGNANQNHKARPWRPSCSVAAVNHQSEASWKFTQSSTWPLLGVSPRGVKASAQSYPKVGTLPSGVCSPCAGPPVWQERLPAAEESALPLTYPASALGLCSYSCVRPLWASMEGALGLLRLG